MQSINFLELSFNRTSARIKRILPVGITNRLRAAGLLEEIEGLEKRTRAVMLTGDNVKILELRGLLDQWQDRTFANIKIVVESSNKKGDAA